MEKHTQNTSSGSYTANLLGNIRSHLAGLQGYDVMALELIQNADDAKAEEIVFNITDEGLYVSNSGQFTYCGDLRTRPCRFIADQNYSCDYHRIADVGSGGKLSRGENIGRFGIGFVSTYQITDHPEIRSSEIKLTLNPEKGQWFIESFDQPKGTTFFLPWASDPNSEARRALGISHISAAHIEQLTEDFLKILRNSLLFLRYVRKAEVRRNGELLLACELDRGNDSELIVSFHPSGEVEQWQILRADAAESALKLYALHPRLESLGRGTKISIGLRIDPEPLTEGMLYAFLPTEQSTGLPIHINADFFPESDRKAVIFAGHQHEQAWNEMLIDVAAAELARDPEGLLKMLGHVPFWQILGRAFDLSKQSNHPICFKRFWERFMVSASKARIVLAQNGSVLCPSDVFFPDKSLTPTQVPAFQEIGGQVVSEDLRQFRTAINQLGAPLLTFERLVTLLEKAMAQHVPKVLQVNEDRVDTYYRPIWGIVNDLLPDAVSPPSITKTAVQRLQLIPFVLTENLHAITIKMCYLTPVGLDSRRIALLLPKLAVAIQQILDFPKIARLFPKLDLGAVVYHIKSTCAIEPVENIIGIKTIELRDLYAMFADLDHFGIVDKTVYLALRDLPIWLSSRGLISATNALLPGNFTDPTGQADLLEPSALTDTAKIFVSVKLEVPTQTIEAFVFNVLPRFFNENGPLDPLKYQKLIEQLSNYPALVNDQAILELLGNLYIVPTQDGKWSRPTNTYKRTDDLVRVLGDARHLWLDDNRIPNSRSVRTFINSLGIRRTPIAQHLVERILYIAEKFLPTEEAKRASSEAFYVLCDYYEKWKEQPFLQGAIDNLRKAACFPVINDDANWHSSKSLYAPYRAEAFLSQVSVLDFRNMAKLSRDLLKKLNISLEPETPLVINHLRHCAAINTPAPYTAYQILNERSKDEGSLISSLSGEPFIYIESQKSFVRSNQLFWMPQQLGRYAFTIPGNLETFKPLFTAIGVNNSPDGHDFIDILLDIVGEYYEQSKVVEGANKLVYDTCLIGASAAPELEEIGNHDIQRLLEAPSILNLMGRPTLTDEILLQDSEWHAGFFKGELDQALCKPAPELWPFIAKIGVRRLSESAKVELEFIDGQEFDESELALKLTERIDILARLLHDKPTTVKRKVRKALSELTAVSYEVVRIQASVCIGENWVSAPPTAVQAFYDINKQKLILARPINERSWSHILNAIFHQLMPEESGSEISKLTLSIRPLMNMPVDEAHRELSDAGIPYLDVESNSVQTDDLTSSSLDNMGGAPDSNQFDTNSDSPLSETQTDNKSPPDKHGNRHSTETETETETTNHSKGDSSSNQQSQVTKTTSQEEDPTNKVHSSTRHDDSWGSTTGEHSTKNPRQKHKTQWDRRLLSYVRKTQESLSDDDTQGGHNEHNLAVEVVARDAVCSYEKSRGRIAEQMAQTHPGYDIISRNPLTGEERIIEVKGVNGEWNQTGVGLSKLQFSNALDYGDRYWLYVVEFVANPQYIRVHAIRSPATQVTSFMFDGNWRDAVSEEMPNPLLAYIPGTRIRHKTFGRGMVTEIMKALDTMRVVKIKYDSGETHPLTLNLKDLPEIEDDYGHDHS